VNCVIHRVLSDERGRLGEVDFRRIVAFKMILKGTFATMRDVARFRAEGFSEQTYNRWRHQYGTGFVGFELEPTTPPTHRPVRVQSHS